MRLLSTLIFVALIAAGGCWLWENNGLLRESVGQYVGSKDLLTLEARYSAQDIMDAHRKELLVDDQHTYQEPSLKFYPYLLLEVKYSLPDRKTREGVILWGMEDGEIVVSTDTWDKTHGFQDALAADANRNDFKIMYALAAHGGWLSRENLLKELQLEPNTIDSWIDSARQKHLIVQQGGGYQLHFENPKLLITPQTKISQWLVTKPYSHASRVSANFSKNQIERVAAAAFGTDFTIRNDKEVFLPVYKIEVLNPDGSVLSSYWNALNGQRVSSRY
jgi:hypothetical protein